MPLRLTMAAAMTVFALFMSACGTGSSSEPTPEPSPEPTASATMGETEIAGTWRSDAEDWTVHFAPDGTFVEDFQGNKGMRSGTWSVEGDVVALEGGDGNTDKGTIVNDTLEFRLGTLVRSQG